MEDACDTSHRALVQEVRSLASTGSGASSTLCAQAPYEQPVLTTYRYALHQPLDLIVVDR